MRYTSSNQVCLTVRSTCIMPVILKGVYYNTWLMNIYSRVVWSLLTSHALSNNNSTQSHVAPKLWTHIQASCIHYLCNEKKFQIIQWLLYSMAVNNELLKRGESCISYQKLIYIYICRVLKYSNNRFHIWMARHWTAPNGLHANEKQLQIHLRPNPPTSIRYNYHHYTAYTINANAWQSSIVHIPNPHS